MWKENYGKHWAASENKSWMFCRTTTVAFVPRTFYISFTKNGFKKSIAHTTTFRRKNTHFATPKQFTETKNVSAKLSAAHKHDWLFSCESNLCGVSPHIARSSFKGSLVPRCLGCVSLGLTMLSAPCPYQPRIAAALCAAPNRATRGVSRFWKQHIWQRDLFVPGWSDLLASGSAWPLPAMTRLRLTADPICLGSVFWTRKFARLLKWPKLDFSLWQTQNLRFCNNRKQIFYSKRSELGNSVVTKWHCIKSLNSIWLLYNPAFASYENYWHAEKKKSVATWKSTGHSLHQRLLTRAKSFFPPISSQQQRMLFV